MPRGHLVAATLDGGDGHGKVAVSLRLLVVHSLGHAACRHVMHLIARLRCPFGLSP